jgi:hypothetical protein
MAPAAGDVLQVIAGQYNRAATETYVWTINGASAGTGPVLVVPEAAVGKRIVCQVTASADDALPWSARLSTVEVVPGAPSPVDQLTPRVAPALASLTPIVGTQLEVLPGDFGPTTVITTCVWRADGAVVASTCGYTPTADVVGARLAVAITVRGGAGTDPWTGTIHTAAVAAAPGEDPQPDPTPSGAPSRPSEPAPSSSPSATASPAPPLVPGTKGVAARVKVAQKSITVLRGKKVKLSARGYAADGSSVALTWTSSKPKVAAVSKSGTITAKKVGKSVVSITSGNKVVKVSVRVVAPTAKARATKVTAVTASGVKRTMKAGQVAWITGKPLPGSAAGATVAFSSSNPAVIAVDAAGKLTAKHPGKAVLTIKSAKKTKKYTIKVI